MPMQREREYILEQARNDKIKTLGFLCYNLYVDGVMVFPEMSVMVDDIKMALEYLLMFRQNRYDTERLHRQEEILNKKLTELGCTCYNMYVDSKLFDNEVMSLCNSILSINQEITMGTEENLSREDSINKNVTQSKLKVTCPYGMEPIPPNFKECVCGYRNKQEARFCGKCGAKLS